MYALFVILERFLSAYQFTLEDCLWLTSTLLSFVLVWTVVASSCIKTNVVSF